MSRRTIDVENVKQYANQILLDSADDLIDYREGIISTVEFVLHNTGNYSGFEYLSAKDMSKSSNGITVGINPDLSFNNTDNTRRRYF